MFSAIKAEILRLISLRSTLVYAILLTGALYGPPVLIVAFADSGSGSAGAITAADLSQCAMIFLLVAIAFAGASTATEIRRGATGVSFLTQRLRWPSFFGRLVVIAVFLTLMYVLGMGLALAVSSLHSAGFDLSDGGWTYMSLFLVQILFWAILAACIAVLTRSTVVAVALPMAWVLLIETLISIVPLAPLQAVAKWTPLNNWTLLLSEIYPGAGGAMINHSAGVAVTAVTGCIAIFIIGAWVSHVKRDIPA